MADVVTECMDEYEQIATLQARAAVAPRDIGPLSHCTCDGNGPDGTGHLPDCGYWRAKGDTGQPEDGGGK